MSRLITICAVFLAFATLAFAQATARISGQVLDPSGTPVPEAAITLTNTATHTASQITSDANGNYTLMDLAPGTYSLRASKPGFESYDHSIVLQAGQTLTASINLALSAVQQTGSRQRRNAAGRHARAVTKATSSCRTRRMRVLDRTQMDMLGPVAGAAQVIALAPGARVTGYGNTGATKYTISINGINQGWGGYGGYSGGAALGITFDGIPIVDPATGLWQTATIPQMQIIQDAVVSLWTGRPSESLVHQRWRGR